MLDTARFSSLEVLGDSFVGGNSFIGGELIVGELDIITDVSVSGMASISSLDVTSFISTPAFVSGSSQNGSFMYIFGDVEFNGDVTGLPEAEGPKHHAARTSSNGAVQYNSGFASIGVSSTQNNQYLYTFETPIAGAQYSVVATSNFNSSNIHCNVLSINGNGFIIETGKSASKPFPCSHSVQVTYG